MRTLVGMEIAHEADRAWKLTRLDPDGDDRSAFGSARRRKARGGPYVPSLPPGHATR